MKQRLIVGITGGSGAPIAIEMLRMLKEFPQIETHMICSRGARLTLMQESGMYITELRSLVDVEYQIDEIGAGPASGSFQTMGMVVVPCSMKTAAGICSGYSDNLLLRAADVTLKERRKLVLVTRECPLSTIHLRNLYELSQIGAEILPPMLTYYINPKTVEDMTRQMAGRILERFGLEIPDLRRWEGMIAADE